MYWIWIAAGLLVLAAGIALLRARNPGAPPAKRQEDATVVLRAEQLELTKTRERRADVSVHREVHRELKTMTVPVTREELVVDRDGVEAARIPLSEERVDVSTRSVPLNEVSVYRREWEENQKVEAVVRKEVARVEATGDAAVSEQNGGGDGPKT